MVWYSWLAMSEFLAGKLYLKSPSIGFLRISEDLLVKAIWSYAYLTYLKTLKFYQVSIVKTLKANSLYCPFFVENKRAIVF